MTAPVDGGAARPLGTVPGGAAGFTEVNGTAYASQTSTSQIVAFPSDGGPSHVFVDAGSNPFALATDGIHLFWCRNEGFVPVYSAPLAGGPTTSFGGAQTGIDDMAVANGNIFWGTYSSAGGIIGSATTDGANARTLASTYDTDLWLASDGVNVYWVGWGASSGDVWQMPVDGGTPLNLASNQGGPYGIAVDDASVFWTTGGSVLKEPNLGRTHLGDRGRAVGGRKRGRRPDVRVLGDRGWDDRAGAQVARPPAPTPATGCVPPRTNVVRLDASHRERGA